MSSQQEDSKPPPSISTVHLHNPSNPLPASSSAFAHALSSNATWAHHTATINPTLFPTLAQAQHPSILWLGCSDSRVPETTILGLQPGDVFVHRNIANVLTSSDLSLACVLEFAVGELKVKDIVVCGHTKCGGVAGACANGSLGSALDAWLVPLRECRARLEKEGVAEGEMAGRLTVEGVRMGVGNVRERGLVIKAMRERGLKVHGAVYDVADGRVKVVDCGEKEEDVKGRERVFGLE